MKKIEEQTRRDIAAFLPEALEMALSSYTQYAMDQVINDEVMAATGFKAHHDACKVAIAHIKLLIDLAKWADLPDAGVEDAEHAEYLRFLMARAQQELDTKI